MARKASQNPTTYFLENLYGDLPGGLVELRLKEDRGEGRIVKRRFTETFKGVEDTLEKFAGRDQKVAAYYGVAKRASKGDVGEDGKIRCGKEHILGASCLWADIDTAKHGWSLQDTMRRLYDLPIVLQPSALVKSGGGIHAYWLLKEPFVFETECEVERAHEVAIFEDGNRMLGALVSGDRIHDTTRVLRLPGSFNSKRKSAAVEVAYFFHWHKHDFGDLIAAADDFGKVLGPDGFVVPTEMPKEYRRAVELDHVQALLYSDGNKTAKGKIWEQLWEKTRLGGGYPYHGIDEAELLGTCNRFFVSDHTDHRRRDWAIDQVFRAVEAVMEKSDPDEWRAWDKDEERAKIAEKFDRWADKWELLNKQIKKQKAAEKKAAKETAVE